MRTLLILLMLALPAGGPAVAGIATFRVDPEAVKGEVVQTVAALGEPLLLEVRQGQTLASLVEEACGWTPDAYFALLAEEDRPGLPASITPESRFGADGVIELPACLRRPTVSSAPLLIDGLLDLTAGYERGTYSYDPRWRPVLTAGGGRDGAPAVSQPGFWTSLRLAPISEEPFGDLAAAIEGALQAGGQAAGTAEVVIDRDPSEADLLSRLSAAELESFDDCQAGVEPDPDLRLDTLEVVKVLTHALGFLRDRGSEPARATVMVPDSGLHLHGERPFGRWLWPRLDDPNSIRPYPAYPKHQHGTGVATVAMGGVEFMEVLGGLNIDLRLTPVRLLQERNIPGEEGVVKEHRISLEDLANAEERRGNVQAVVNLSLTRGTRIEQLERFLNHDSPTLFVAAAGNDGAVLGTDSAYPALYSIDRPNVLTVAALDLDGTLAGFSNRGSAYVGLAAPGCEVPVLEYDAETRAMRRTNASGTSFAAPQVSFTAALLRAIWPEAQPADLKRRLLTSATVSSRLDPTQVADRRRLDPVKALTVYQDVVEVVVDGERRLIRGKVDPAKVSWSSCDGENLLRLESWSRRPKARAVKKIVLLPTEGGVRRIEYFTDVGGRLVRQECDASELVMTIREDFTGDVYTFGLDELHDVVFAEFPVE